MKILQPPSPLPPAIATPTLFLAGSIEQGTAIDWQQEVAIALSDLDITLFNPRRDTWDPSWVQKKENPNFREQVEWELDALERADWIAVYFDPQTRSPITLLELGLFARSQKVLLCCPEGFWRRGNVEIVADRFGIPFFETLEELIAAVRQRVS